MPIKEIERIKVNDRVYKALNDNENKCNDKCYDLEIARVNNYEFVDIAGRPDQIKKFIKDLKENDYCLAFKYINENNYSQDYKVLIDDSAIKDENSYIKWENIKLKGDMDTFLLDLRLVNERIY